MADIFVSYSSYDRAKAEQLVTQLETAGHSVWIDQHGIGGALNWSAEIVDAISECTTVAFLISAHSVSSENVAREIHLASEKKKNILPIIIEETQLPRIFEYPLAGLQRVRYERTEDILHAVELLKQGHSILEQMQTPASRISDDGYVHLAVLPFDDLSPQHDNEWFADGMMDELISTLGALEKLRVPSRTDVLYYRTHKPKAKEIAKDLGVRYLVEGSVRKAGEKIRITTTLIDTHANHQIWTNRFDGTFDDIFDFQDKVSREITEALKLKLTPAEVQKITSDPTQNVEAYELYLRGLEYQRLITRDGYEKALKFYDQALTLDSDFIDAMLAAASTCSAYYREYSRDPNWLHKADIYLSKAEFITGETGRTLWIRGEIAWIRGEYELAEKLLLKGKSLDPSYTGIYNILGNLYNRLNRLEDAAEAFSHAVSMEPTIPGYFNLLVVLYDLDDRIRLQKIANDAIHIFQKHIARHPNDRNTEVNFAFVLICADKKNDALHLMDNISGRHDLDGISLFNLGTMYDELGHTENCIRFFKQAIDSGFREVEALRIYKLTDQSYQQQLDDLISRVEQIIDSEKQSVLTTTHL